MSADIYTEKCNDRMIASGTLQRPVIPRHLPVVVAVVVVAVVELVADAAVVVAFVIVIMGRR